MDMARNALYAVARNVRPVSSRVAAVAKRGGEVAGGTIRAGSVVTGGVIAGLGAVAIGGVAGAALVAGGGLAVAAGYGGGWIVQKVGDGTAHGIALSGAITETSLTVGCDVMSAISAVLTKSQVELVLGQEGAAVLEYIAHMWQQERQTIDGLKDVTYSQLVQGIVALCCLQRVRRVGYGSKGFVLHRSMGIADKEAEDWRWQEEQHMGGGRDSAHELRRSMHISSLCYSVLLDMVVGSGKTKASSALLGSRRENLVAALNLRSKDDVVAAQWETEGPHAPGYLLIADRRGGGRMGRGI